MPVPQFVNYRKRSFTLPPGCKNLIDVLARSRRKAKGQIATCGFPPLEIKKERVPTGGLAQIGRYMEMLLQSRGELFTLSVTGPGFQYPVAFCRSRSERTVAIILVCKDARQEQAIRTLFEQHGLEASLDHLVGDTPDATRGLAYPLPLDVARATSLATELLRNVYGLSEEAGLDFLYYEKV